jgi:hypothetical protein
MALGPREGADVLAAALPEDFFLVTTGAARLVILSSV